MNREYAEHILQLNQPWTRKDVRKAYKVRAKELHPDKHPTRKDMATKFVELKEAHDYLLGWEHTDDEHRNTETTNLEELLIKLTESYQEALVPFICALPPRKQQWIIEFLEMYGEVLLGEEVIPLLEQIRKESPESILKTTSEMNTDVYQVHFVEMLMDKIIVHEVEDEKTFIPSWANEWNGQPIMRNIPAHVSIDASNNLFFHISLSFRTLYTMNQDTIQLNQSYFSGSHMVHVVGSVPRSKIQITKGVQRIQEAEIDFIHLYDDQGNILCENHEGIFLPDEPMDTPLLRSSCSWLISLIP